MQINNNTPSFGSKVILDKSLKNMGSVMLKEIKESVPALKTLADDTVTFRLKEFITVRKDGKCLGIVAEQKDKGASFLKRLFGKKITVASEYTEESSDGIIRGAKETLEYLKSAQKESLDIRKVLEEMKKLSK